MHLLTGLVLALAKRNSARAYTYVGNDSHSFCSYYFEPLEKLFRVCRFQMKTPSSVPTYLPSMYAMLDIREGSCVTFDEITPYPPIPLHQFPIIISTQHYPPLSLSSITHTHTLSLSLPTHWVGVCYFPISH